MKWRGRDLSRNTVISNRLYAAIENALNHRPTNNRLKTAFSIDSYRQFVVYCTCRFKSSLELMFILYVSQSQNKSCLVLFYVILTV